MPNFFQITGCSCTIETMWGGASNLSSKSEAKKTSHGDCVHRSWLLLVPAMFVQSGCAFKKGDLQARNPGRRQIYLLKRVISKCFDVHPPVQLQVRHLFNRGTATSGFWQSFFGFFTLHLPCQKSLTVKEASASRRCRTGLAERERICFSFPELIKRSAQPPVCGQWQSKWPCSTTMIIPGSVASLMTFHGYLTMLFANCVLRTVQQTKRLRRTE